LKFAVDDQDESSTGTTEDVGASTFEHSGGTFILEDLLGAVSGVLVHALFDGFLRLHLETTTDGIEGVGDETGHDDGELGTGPLGGDTDEAGFTFPGVDAQDGIVQTELGTTVRDDTGDGDTETVVEGHDTLGTLDGLGEAVTETVESLLAGTDIGGQTSTGVVERVDEAERTGTGQTARSQVHGEKGPELSLGAVLGEHGFDGILEGQVESLGGEITDAVGKVTGPVSLDTLFLTDAGKAVDDTGVTFDFTRLDLGVGILSLDDQLDTLDRSSDRLGDGTSGTAEGEILQEIRFVVSSHFVSIK